MDCDFEKILLGGWLQGKHLEDVRLLKAADFKHYPHLFSAIVEKGSADIIGICKLANVNPTELADMITCYQKTFYESARRELFDEKARVYLLNHSHSNSLPEVIETLQGFVREDFVDLPKPSGSEVFTDYIEELDSRKARELVYTGVSGLDDILCGIRTKELTSIAARPATGKSAFTLQVASHVASQGKRVLYIPLEMSEEQTVERLLLQCRKGKGFHVAISAKELRAGSLSQLQWQGLSKAVEVTSKLISDKNFLLCEGVNDLDAILGLIREYKPYLVVVDQLEQLTAKRKFSDKRERFSFVTNSLKRIAMTENVSIWLVCQVNRTAEKVAPTMANIKESGSIEEDSDNVILLHRYMVDDDGAYRFNPGSPYSKVNWGGAPIYPVDIGVAKQRSGGTGLVCTKFIAHHFTFDEIL